MIRANGREAREATNLRRVLARVVGLAGLNDGNYTIWVDGDGCETYPIHRVCDKLLGLSENKWPTEKDD